MNLDIYSDKNLILMIYLYDFRFKSIDKKRERLPVGRDALISRTELIIQLLLLQSTATPDRVNDSRSKEKERDNPPKKRKYGWLWRRR